MATSPGFLTSERANSIMPSNASSSRPGAGSPQPTWMNTRDQYPFVPHKGSRRGDIDPRARAGSQGTGVLARALAPALVASPGPHAYVRTPECARHMANPPPGFRIEKDTMGEMLVPKDALYAASTQRAVENF